MSAVRSYKRKPPLWGFSDLVRLREDLAKGSTLSECATRQRCATASDCDLAAWALLGRTPSEAAFLLNRGRQ